MDPVFQRDDGGSKFRVLPLSPDSSAFSNGMTDSLFGKSISSFFSQSN
jgi:hypothetical protein